MRTLTGVEFVERGEGGHRGAPWKGGNCGATAWCDENVHWGEGGKKLKSGKMPGVGTGRQRFSTSASRMSRGKKPGGKGCPTPLEAILGAQLSAAGKMEDHR